LSAGNIISSHLSSCAKLRSVTELINIKAKIKNHAIRTFEQDSLKDKANREILLQQQQQKMERNSNAALTQYL